MLWHKCIIKYWPWLSHGQWSQLLGIFVLCLFILRRSFIDGASEYSKVWLTQPISSHAKPLSQAQQLSKLRKECVYFQTKVKNTTNVELSESQKNRKCKNQCKKLKFYPRNSRRFITALILRKKTRVDFQQVCVL